MAANFFNDQLTQVATPEELTALHQTVLRYSEVSRASLDRLTERCQVHRVAHAQHLIQENTRERHEYFLVEGIAHRYNITESGAKVTTGFYFPRTTLTPHFARTSRDASLFAVQAITDVTVFKVEVGDMDQLRGACADLRLFGERVVEEELSRVLQYEVAFRSMSARERLTMVRENYPAIENMVPHTVLASFLGITPVSFSRLRAQIY
ncbi:Crp/Fnr family transcriptional regulator [Pontibacter anaerobius]|uniref:Crp/Fnr family transcriptional regulator n=1 Tax=Pontibacter anaerobius TaxID=2993940 RepID=A0ABT3RBT4_9BACT|nr:Crp/Fnr family transcriptional regulator [Pontibacter anaerobius]MCX2739069.1 Crp/Fnr family transcriptional regulator [Pontibacter anaerobius]